MRRASAGDEATCDATRDAIRPRQVDVYRPTRATRTATAMSLVVMTSSTTNRSSIDSPKPTTHSEQATDCTQTRCHTRCRMHTAVETSATIERHHHAETSEADGTSAFITLGEQEIH
jgi:hypothetical protein